ncbi:hypothetical protein [Streptomyces sp. NPDC059909]|uniref:hypothetical protein n=1 Tax=Streptomyces sp. NPDC059909 TaxID=3346998 RepID=UPI00365EA3C0
MRELCRTPGCNDTPAHDVIVHCRHHLAERPVSELVSMASDWGYYHCEGISDPTLLMGSPDADLLVKAAVVHGAFEQVTTALLNACFDDPHTLEERHLWDESAAIAIRYAMDRERVRLQQIATTEARRIKKATGSCTACGQALPPWINLHLPPQFCSKKCTPPSPDKDRAWSPWSEHIAPA